jgi:hypothetical protein
MLENFAAKITELGGTVTLVKFGWQQHNEVLL